MRLPFSRCWFLLLFGVAGAPVGCGGSELAGFLHGPDRPADQPTRDAGVDADAGAAAPGSSTEAGPSGGGQDAGSGGLTGGSRDRFCDDPGASPERCGDSLPSQAFAHALCTCENASGLGKLATASRGADEGVASLALNGELGLRIGDLVSLPGDRSGRIAGDVIIADSKGSAVAGWSDRTPFIQGDLRMAGPLDLVGNVRVAEDAWLPRIRATNGLVPNVGALRIQGDLYLGSDAEGGLSFVTVDGQIHRERRHVEPPCPCGEDAPVSVSATVAEAASQHDNGAAGLDVDTLSDAAARQLALDCGRYFFHRIDVQGDLALKITGRTALYVQGDMSVDGDVRVELAPGAQLALFVASDLRLAGAARFAQSQRAASSRIYVGGELVFDARADPPNLPQPEDALGDVLVVGNFYAPHAEPSFVSSTDIYGNLFVRTLNVTQGVKIHHDPAARAAWGCP